MGTKRRSPTAGEPDPWYAEGLRFECQPDCGACCTNHDDYAYVYLEGDDLERLAAFLRLSPAAFKRRYTRLDDGHRVLRMDRPDCPFLDGGRCTVYPVRPVQCRTVPFWGENLATPEAWRRLSGFCPGVGRGRRHSLLRIRTQVELRGEQ